MNATSPTKNIELAENEASIFIRVNKVLLENEKLRQALQLLRDVMNEPEVEVDEYGIPYVGDEEQAEIEASLDKLTDEDKEIAWTETITL